MLQLRPFQSRLIDRLRQVIVDGFRAPLVVSPCGSGKTVMFAWLAHRLIESGYRIDILNHRTELSDQISDTLDQFGVRHGIIAAGTRHYDRSKLVHVASAFSVVRRLDKLDTPRYLFIDEGHHAVEGTTWSKIIAFFKERNPGLIVVGWTATPERLGGEGLSPPYDCIVHGPQPRELIEQGYLSDYRLYAPPPAEGIDFSAVHHRGGDFVKGEVTELMSKPQIYGSAIAHYKRLLDGAPAIVYTASVAHAHNAAEQFASHGYRAVALDGHMGSNDRKQAIRDFSMGRLNVVTSCDLISEGLDVPGARGMIGLRPTESLALCMQQWGRVLRPDKGKDYAIICDHVNNWKRHGLPDSERQWSLKGHAGAKAKKDPDDIAIRQCGSCGAVMRAQAKQCPQCGAVLPVKERKIEQVDGELEEIKKEQAKWQKKRETATAQDLETLIKLGRMRGYKNPEYWAQKVWESRQQKKSRQRDMWTRLAN